MKNKRFALIAVCLILSGCTNSHTSGSIVTSGSAASTTIREINDQEHRVSIDKTDQVIAVSTEEKSDGDAFGDAPELLAVPPVAKLSQFVSASILTAKAKQFDDGLYAAVELAAEKGKGKLGSKVELLNGIANKLNTRAQNNALTFIATGCKLGEVPISIKHDEASVQAKVDEFNTDEARSKPIGFYTWSAELQRIFKQDRWYQGRLSTPDVMAIYEALKSDPNLSLIYTNYLQMVSGLTNPFTASDFRAWLSGEHPSDTRFFPPSRSHEAALLRRMFHGEAPPPNFDLFAEIIKAIRSNKLDLKPTKESGWYDYQWYAMEPFLIPEKQPESSHVEFNEPYKKLLEELFKGTLALTRETHIKQLETPMLQGAASGSVGPLAEPVTIRIQPGLSAEPLATAYLRRYQSYKFVHELLTKYVGADGLRSMHRIYDGGQSSMNLEDELNQMENIFLGAYINVWSELGLPAHNAPHALDSSAPKTFDSWRQNLQKDRDLATDVRMMVPAFYDDKRGLFKVWAFLGWTPKDVTLSYKMEPKILETKYLGKGDKPEVKVEFEPQVESAYYPNVKEIYVKALLNRQEFRSLCDKKKTEKEILKAISVDASE